MMNTRSSMNSQTKVRKPKKHVPMHPKSRAVSGGGKTAKPAGSRKGPIDTGKSSKTPTGRSGGAFKVKNQPGHVATHGGSSRSRRSKVSASRVAKALHRIK